MKFLSLLPSGMTETHLVVITIITIILSDRYVTKSASAAHDEWVTRQEAIAAAEAAAAAEDYVYEYETGEGSGEGSGEWEECLVCEEGEYYDEEDENPAPRFFFSQISQIFDTTRNLPCCKESDIRQTETTTEPTGPR